MVKITFGRKKKRSNNISQSNVHLKLQATRGFWPTSRFETGAQPPFPRERTFNQKLLLQENHSSRFEIQSAQLTSSNRININDRLMKDQVTFDRMSTPCDVDDDDDDALKRCTEAHIWPGWGRCLPVGRMKYRITVVVDAQMTIRITTTCCRHASNHGEQLLLFIISLLHRDNRYNQLMAINDDDAAAAAALKAIRLRLSDCRIVNRAARHCVHHGGRGIIIATLFSQRCEHADKRWRIVIGIQFGAVAVVLVDTVVDWNTPSRRRRWRRWTTDFTADCVMATVREMSARIRMWPRSETIPFPLRHGCRLPAIMAIVWPGVIGHWTKIKNWHHQ